MNKSIIFLLLTFISCSKTKKSSMYNAQNNRFNNENASYILQSPLNNIQQIGNNITNTLDQYNNNINGIISVPNQLLGQGQRNINNMLEMPTQFLNDINTTANNFTNTINTVANMPNQLIGNFNTIMQAPQNVMSSINNFSNMLTNSGGIVGNISQGIVSDIAGGAMDMVSSAGTSGVCGFIDGLFGFSEGQKRKTEEAKQETERQRQRTMGIVKEVTIEQGRNIDKQRKNITESGKQQRLTMADGHKYQMEAINKNQSNRMEFLNQTVQHKKDVMTLEHSNNKEFEVLKHDNTMNQMNTSIQGKKDIIILQNEREKQNMMIKHDNTMDQMNTSIQGKKDIIVLQNEREKQNMMIKQMNNLHLSQELFIQRSTLRKQDHQYNSQLSLQNYTQETNIKNLDHQNKSNYSRQSFLQMKELSDQNHQNEIEEKFYQHNLELNKIYENFRCNFELNRQNSESKIDEINTLYNRKERLNRKEYIKMTSEMEYKKNLQTLKYLQEASLQKQEYIQNKDLTKSEHEEKRLTEQQKFKYQKDLETERFKRKLYFNNLDAIKTNLPSFNITPLVFRNEYIELIEQKFEIDKNQINWNSQNKICSLYGFGGIGKTVLALTFAYQNFENSYEMIWWINAKNEELIINSLREIAWQMGMKTAQTDSEVNIINYVKLKISQQKSKWLVIWDNLLDINLLNKYSNIKSFYPSFGGHILITSRNIKSPFKIHIDNLTKNQTIEVCEALTFPKNVNESNAMQELVFNNFDSLPLAIVQACEYMNDTAIGYEKYLNLKNFMEIACKKMRK